MKSFKHYQSPLFLLFSITFLLVLFLSSSLYVTASSTSIDVSNNNEGSVKATNDDSDNSTKFTIIGYVGTFIAIIFYGSNYVVTKKYPTGDGVVLSWLMSNGILLVGFVSLALTTNNKLIFIPTGILGGSLWSMGNLMVIPIVKTVGLGLGFLLWSGSNLIGGYLVGKIGLFGIEREVIDSVGGNVVNIFGIVGGVISMLLFFFIKPNKEEDAEKKKLEDGPITIKENNGGEHVEEEGNESSALLPSTNMDDSEVKLTTNNFTNFNENTTFGKIKKIAQSPIFLRVLGFCMAIFSGCLYAVNMVPFKVWAQHEIYIHGKQPGPIDFAFSQFSGIYLFHSFVLIIYVLVKRNRPEVYPNMILSSIVCGIMWAIATCGLFYSSAYLGFTVGYVLVAIGPSLVSTFWNTVVFREIKGLKNLIILGASLSFAVIGVVLLAVSKMI
ncbi:hypothetical protein ABK040_011575 [Willaertia magna]